jgi:TolA-binding protein
VTDRRTDLEDLCALGRRGLLSESEERELARALRASPSLRAVHEVGLDFDRSTAVRAGDEALIARVADAALSRVAKSGLASNTPQGPRSGFVRSPRRRRSLAVLLAAAMVCLTGAAAAVWSGVVPTPWFGAAQQRVLSAPEASSPLTANTAQRAAAPSLLAVPPPEPGAEPAPGPAPRADEPFAASRPLPARAVSPDEYSAAALFRAANAARRDGDFDRAKRAYSDLIARYPGSDEARLARVSLGKLLLAKGNASGAAREFDEYLKGGHGQLTEEALVSRAQSLQKLGHAEAERRTWQGLLAGYPNSVYSAEAKRRLEALRREATSSAP